jgi:cytochrome c biogenesis protein CcdA
VENLTLLSLFLMGLSYGSSACLFSCMPFLSPILINRSENIKASMEVMIHFSLGRLFSYSIIAIIASYSSILIKELISDRVFINMILGFVTILVGVLIIKGSMSEKKSCCSTSSHQPTNRASYFMMGSMISFNLCMPVLSLITASAYASNIWSAWGMGLSFGIGAVLASFLVFGVILSMIAKEIVVEFSKYRTKIEISAGVILMVVGVATILGWVKV